MLYRILRQLAYFSVRVFFRRIEVEGVENVPESGRLLLGDGDAAGNEAGRMKQPLKMWVLLPVEKPEE